MNYGKTVFSQIMDFLPMCESHKCVERYHGNRRVRSFSCEDQFLCMAFARLTYRESLRGIDRRDEKKNRVMPLMNSATGFRAHRMLEVVVKGITLKKN